MYSHLERSSKSRSALIFVFGVIVLVLGAMIIKPSFGIFQIIFNEYGQAGTPYSYNSLIFAGLWLIVAVSTLVTGLSLLISAITRRKYDLIPGPTLYFLGLSLSVIGGFLLMNELAWLAISAIVIGLFLIYWEWAYHVS